MELTRKEAEETASMFVKQVITAVTLITIVAMGLAAVIAVRSPESANVILSIGAIASPVIIGLLGYLKANMIESKAEAIEAKTDKIEKKVDEQAEVVTVIHKEVNSTAKVLAQEKIEDAASREELVKEVASLREYKKTHP